MSSDFNLIYNLIVELQVSFAKVHDQENIHKTDEFIDSYPGVSGDISAWAKSFQEYLMGVTQAHHTSQLYWALDEIIDKFSCPSEHSQNQSSTEEKEDVQ